MHLRRVSRNVALISLIAAGAARPALAQTAPPQPITAGWQDGFVIQTPNGDNRLVIGLMAQMDGRVSLNDPPATTDTFFIRKARPTLSGRIAKYFDFKVMPDFGNGAAVLMDAYVDLRFAPALRVRMGKDKTPVGYEFLIGDGYLLFPERTLASSLVPNRDVGVQVQGDLAGGRLGYSGGVFNGVPDGTNSTSDTDTNNGKDLAARVTIAPFRSASGPQRALAGLGVHLGGSTGRESGALPAFKTSSGQTYFSYAAGTAAAGRRNRFAPAIFYYYKSIGAFAEYIRSGQTIVRSGVETAVANHAWDVTGSIVLTGEPASDRGVRPKNSFDPAAGHWGALQLVARYSTLAADARIFADSLTAAGASPDASSFAIGANWYPAAYIKYYVTFERTTFGPTSTSTRAPEHLIIFRTQLSF